MERRGLRLTDRDGEICVFLTCYGAATAEQIRREFFVSKPAAYRRLGALQRRGFVVGERIFYRRPAIYRVTGRGARHADVDLPEPRPDETKLEHTLEVVELSHAIRNGLRTDGSGTVDWGAGPWSAWVTERELRRDKLKERREKGTGRVEPGGRMGRTPDGILVLNDGRQVAVELELSPKRKDRYDRIFADYRRQKRAGEIDLVRWYFASSQVMRRVAGIAERGKASGFCEFRLYGSSRR